MEDIECLERENEKEITVRMERFHQVFRNFRKLVVHLSYVY
jgi:hypothetical protein